MTVRKAVIPAAGYGTRFLPASKAVPKEMLPVVDRPGIQYAVEEAARAGIRDIVIVTSRGKSAMEDHFDYSPDLEDQLERSGKKEELAEIRRVAELAEVHFVRQREQLGFGHAVLQAREHVGNEPCAVLVPDEIVPEPVGDEEPVLENMIHVFERHGGNVIALKKVPREEIASYGVADAEPLEGPVVRVRDLVEKPDPKDAPSELAAVGRYVVEPEVFDAIARTDFGVGNEIQFTDALKLLAHERSMFGYVLSGPILDVGRKNLFLQATVELALRRPDLAEPFRKWLVEFLET